MQWFFNNPIHLLGHPENYIFFIIKINNFWIPKSIPKILFFKMLFLFLIEYEIVARERHALDCKQTAMFFVRGQPSNTLLRKQFKSWWLKIDEILVVENNSNLGG